ncbi:MAG: hypothetical protein WA843_02550 [Candidatus Saccharimonadales bacterium]
MNRNGYPYSQRADPDQERLLAEVELAQGGQPKAEVEATWDVGLVEAARRQQELQLAAKNLPRPLPLPSSSTISSMPGRGRYGR